MKTAIVYYSMSGNTATAAKKVVESLQADLIEIKPEKSFPDKGFKKFLWGGKSAVMAETPKLTPYTFEPDKYDQIVIGFPVWASNVAPPIRTFATENKETVGKKNRRLCLPGRKRRGESLQKTAGLSWTGFLCCDYDSE